jgi:hypothetical protein
LVLSWHSSRQLSIEENTAAEELAQDLLAAALLEEQSVRLVLHAEVEERRHYLLQQAF